MLKAASDTAQEGETQEEKQQNLQKHARGIHT